MASSNPDPPPTAPGADERAQRDREAGFIAIEWIAAMVFLLLPVVLIGAGVSRWPERQQVARASAAEAARAAVLAETQADAQASARRIAAEVATNYGVPSGEYRIEVDADTWDWGEDVTVTVTMSMPALDVPGVGTVATTEWSTSVTQRIEDYRGLE
ncbi:MAG: hypothetical protein AAF467_03475 [Actinomycetota bacterium]